MRVSERDPQMEVEVSVDLAVLGWFFVVVVVVVLE